MRTASCPSVALYGGAMCADGSWLPILLPLREDRADFVGDRAESGEIDDRIKIAADIGDPGKPRPGQRNPGQWRERNDLARIGELEQPEIGTRLDAEQTRCTLPAGPGQPLGEVEAKALALPSTKTRYADLGAEPVPLETTEFKNLLAKEGALLSKLIKEQKIIVD